MLVAITISGSNINNNYNYKVARSLVFGSATPEGEVGSLRQYESTAAALSVWVNIRK